MEINDETIHRRIQRYRLAEDNLIKALGHLDSTKDHLSIGNSAEEHTAHNSIVCAVSALKERKKQILADILELKMRLSKDFWNNHKYDEV